MTEQLIVSIAPHIKDKVSTNRIMWAVFLALIPAGAAGVFIFGANAFYAVLVAMAAAVLSEMAVLALRKQDMKIVLDGSALVTGLLLAYNLPPQVPLWIPAAGSIFAIVIGKHAFGGLGHNIFNPALAGRAFLMISWPVYMTTWQNPRWAVDAVTGATPLALYRTGQCALVQNMPMMDLFLGNRPGCIGEVCVLALLIGAAYLFIKKYITWHIPFSYIGTVALLSWAFVGCRGFFKGEALFFILSGGLVLGAFFMATDYVTSPLTARGKIIFGIGCGVLTVIIRRFSGYPEGVSYAILIMNAVVPIIDRYTFPKWFGQKSA